MVRQIRQLSVYDCVVTHLIRVIRIIRVMPNQLLQNTMTTHQQIILQAAAIIERIATAEQQLARAVSDPQALEAAQDLLTKAYHNRACHEALYPWVWFSEQNVRSMVRAIASMAEESYRRGIQQGEAMEVSQDDAAWFRYECRLPEEKEDGLYRLSIPSPEEGVRRKVHRHWPSCIDLLDRELPYDGHNQKQPFAVLRGLVNWYQKKFGRHAKAKAQMAHTN
jgi:hypothetical protein